MNNPYYENHPDDTHFGVRSVYCGVDSRGILVAIWRSGVMRSRGVFLNGKSSFSHQYKNFTDAVVEAVGGPINVRDLDTKGVTPINKYKNYQRMVNQQLEEPSLEEMQAAARLTSASGNMDLAIKVWSI